MLGPHRRPPPSPGGGGYLTCYSIVIACAALLLLSVLSATVSFAKACAFAAAVGALFGVVGCFARLCVARARARGGGGVLPTLTAAPAPARGLVVAGAAIDDDGALPAFAYARPAAGSGSGKSSGRCALCPVCLEDVQAGEIVRRLPACGHLFHVECIDMWLHSHATCPLCRRDVSLSPQPATVKATAGAVSGAVQPPADGALPPV